VLLDLGPDITPRAVVGDKGYDSKGHRSAARQRSLCPVIPLKASARIRPAFFPKVLYQARARIEQLVGKLKRFKRVALRCEKTVQNYGSVVASLSASSLSNPSTPPAVWSRRVVVHF
jgi:transposase